MSSPAAACGSGSRGDNLPIRFSETAPANDAGSPSGGQLCARRVLGNLPACRASAAINCTQGMATGLYIARCLRYAAACW